MLASDYIQQSTERVATRFSETRRLLAIWTDAARLNLHQPNAEHRELANRAHAEYKAEQARALGQSTTS